MMISDDHFFGSLDACFIGIDQTSNDPLVWKCEGMQVQHRFELPIPSLAGSVCKYSFSTTIGDIAFSVEYRCKGRPDEKIFGNSRVPSDLEQISGTFKSVREGTLLFIFDNSFSWYNPKILTYKIELFQPAFQVADNLRCVKSRSMLKVVVEDTAAAVEKFTKNQIQYQQLRDEIPVLEEKLAEIMTEINSKKTVLSSALEIAKEMKERILVNNSKKSGLCIRCLNKKNLQSVLEFLGPQSSAVVVCKYWRLCLK